MKKLLVAAVASLAIYSGSPASADGLSMKDSAPARSCAQLGGYYAGVHGGWTHMQTSWLDEDNWIDNFSFDFNTSSVQYSEGGLSGGVQVGRNWQQGCTLFGLQLDASFADVSTSKSMSPAVGGTTLNIEDKLHGYGTLRGRTGLIVDNLLLYVTGGVAYASIKHNWTIVDPTIPATEAFSAKKDRWGGVVGFGTEWAWDKWSLQSEVLYIMLEDEETKGFSTAGAQNVKFNSEHSLWVSRLGLNYRW